MFMKQVARCFHTTRLVLAADKSSLAVLRKKTGYTFSNCKKALELHNNDVIKAENWLKEQAQSLGWSKATKLEGRTTKQGLVGVLIQNNISAMIEINCETDFVARNKNFKQFVDEASQACIQYMYDVKQNGNLTKIALEGDKLKQLVTESGASLGDQLALLIGTVGENASLRRAICVKAPESVELAGFTHPQETNEHVTGTVQTGKFGAVIAIRAASEANAILKKNICQHIVGMNPKKIGEMGKDEPTENDDDETCLIHQEYLLDPSQTVNEVLESNSIEIVDFQRYECGESLTPADDNVNGPIN